MSYDISIIRVLNDVERLEVDDDYTGELPDGSLYVYIKEVGNYTYNIAPMISKAMGTTYTGLHTLNVKVVAKMLKTCIRNMEDTPDDYIELEPDNKWGTYEGCLDFTRKFYQMCMMVSDDCMVHVS